MPYSLQSLHLHSVQCLGLLSSQGQEVTGLCSHHHVRQVTIQKQFSGLEEGRNINTFSD